MRSDRGAPTGGISHQLVLFAGRLLLLAPIGAFVIALNLAVDPLHLFGSGAPERRYASALLAGHNIVSHGRFNDRLIAKYYIEGLPRRPDVALIGSSRSMAIHGSCFPDGSFVNLSLGGANLKDHVAVYTILRERNRLPRTVVLNLDPWLLNRNGANTWWVTLEPEYKRGLERVVWDSYGRSAVVDRAVPWRYLRLASLQYFRFSLRVTWNYVMNAPDEELTYVAIPRTYDDDFVRWADGSYSWPEPDRSATVEQVRKVAMEYTTDGIPNYLGSFTELDPDAQQLLTAFLGAVKRDGVRVLLLLTPYHPVAYAGLLGSRKYRIIADAETYFRRVASTLGIPIIGSYDPTVGGFQEGDFYDASHTSDTALERWLLTSRLAPHSILDKVGPPLLSSGLGPGVKRPIGGPRLPFGRREGAVTDARAEQRWQRLGRRSPA